MPGKAERCTELAKSHPGIDFDIDQSLYCRQSIPKQVACTLKGTKQVAQHREITIFDTGKEQSRATGGINPALNRADFQRRVHFNVDTFELPRSFQSSDSLLQISITHDE